MKLLFNTQSLLPPLTGIGNYTFNLLEQLLLEDIEVIDCFLGARFYSAEQALANCIEASACYSQKDGGDVKPGAGQQVALQLRELLKRWTFTYRAREALVDARRRYHAGERRHYLYHEPNFILKPHPGPSIATIHDLSFLHYPQFHPRKRVEWLTAQLPHTLKRADFLITDSDLIRDELIGDFGVSADKVRTVYLGASARYYPQTPEQTSATLQRHGLQHGRYVLFVGTLEPRKGVDTLIDAWCQLPQGLREEYPLVLAGAPGWHNHELNERIKTLTVTHGLRQLSFVSGDDLPTLYAGAAVFSYPSLYEGFGLPVLEAMQCGVPVICTADTSMAEFCQGSAVLVERGNADQLAVQLAELLSDEPLRSKVANAGQLRATAFSWKRCAQETLAVYRAVSP
ncbi:TPA: glycosyltransferase family 4 protein [Pseudomonas putida]|uniref:Glycosyl transferase group 1 n=1 Tax=Pseudomonas putida (strain W619) TaxID=390235 RepID=B1J5H7_PSEPW|nr:glycosyltransferase family 1 protein [Pseudomonas putida]QQE85426.1 glycosyltransferase family 4 protein [Pseudomonas putida]HEN8713121.1 glycosyltransferase family 4 protein [Pseudomonas putida]HEN8718126.1 glycosyltransferase family 4 protein [Pseudomonas putida]